MDTIKKHPVFDDEVINNPIYQMITDKQKIIEAVKNSEKVSNIKGIKIVSPL